MKLVVATDEQKRARDRQAHAAWGAQLSVDGYMEREERLRAHPWAKQTMDTWFLVGDGGEVLASCETYRMDGWQRGVRGDVWGVASVFTEEGLRGRGLATALIDRLLERARAASAVASILYSDVGARQYERSGYRVRLAEDLLFTPLTGDPADGIDALVADHGRAIDATSSHEGRELNPLATHDARILESIATHDARILDPIATHDARVPDPTGAHHSRVLDTPGTSSTTEAFVGDTSGLMAPTDEDFIVWPTAAQLDWHVERTRSYAALLGRPTLRWIGARASSGEIRWMVDWKSNSLKILLLATRRADEATALVRAARRTAGSLALREVRLWAQPWSFLGAGDSDGALDATRVARPDSLPMIAPLLPSLAPDSWHHIPRAVWV